jgi:hypothetical protein
MIPHTTRPLHTARPAASPTPATYHDVADPWPATGRPVPRAPAAAAERGTFERSLAIGAKTLAGIGLGVVGVLVGAAALGVALEAILVPTLVLKLAAGITGGSVGLAKGLGDERRREQPPIE